MMLSQSKPGKTLAKQKFLGKSSHQMLCQA